MNSCNSDLNNLWVVVTRPAHQAAAISRRIEQRGGKVIRFPVIEIEAPVNPDRLYTVLRTLENYDWLVFVSANAVRMGLRAITGAGIARPRAKLTAVGVRTAQALEQQGWTVDVVPQPPYNSESLLAEPAMQRVQGQHFLIFRGENGREFLRDTLISRGAAVDYAECYRRVPARSDPRVLETAWSQRQLDVIMITSVTGIENLVNLAGQQHRGRLLRTPLVVAGDRVAKSAHERGWLAPVVAAADATDDAMLAALHTLGTEHAAGN